MTTLSDLKTLVAKGDSFSLNESRYALELLEALSAQVTSKDRQLDEMDAMVDRARKSLRSQRSVTTIVDLVRDHHKGGHLKRVVDGPFFNVDEVTRLACKLLSTEEELEQYKSVNKELAVEAPTRDAEKVLQMVEDNDISRFSFVEVRQLIDHLKAGRNSAGRRPRNKLNEIHALLNSPNTGELFYPAEMRLMRKWGCEREEELNSLKRKLARAFANPVAWVDSATGFLLKGTDKKEMLKSGSINVNHFQVGLHARPEEFTIPVKWVPDAKEQQHAGDYFHTKPDGTWWSGKMFADLTSHQLQNVLETALGDLRALYLNTQEEPK